MDTCFTTTIDKGSGPQRLFVGGVHGKEGQTTILALKSFNKKLVPNGKLLLYNFPNTKYISTIQREYYETDTGQKLLKLLKTIKPNIYLELHCYHRENIQKLTNKNRKKDSGIPSLVELEEGVLMGSVSPIIRSAFFKKFDFPFILEIPCQPEEKMLKIYQKVMNIAATSEDRLEILERLGAIYPDQVKILNKYFVEFMDNFFLLFKKTSQYALENRINNKKDFNQFMGKLVSDWDLDLNPLQISQVADSVLIFLTK